MKKIISFLLVISIVMVMVVGCGSKDNKSTGTSDNNSVSKDSEKENAKPIRIGYIQNFAAHEFYANIVKGQKETAEKLGVELLVVDANLDIAKQISFGENFLAQDIDALIITPVDATGILPLIEQAMAAGIPVITESVKASKQTAYVGIEDFDGGYLDGLYAGQYLLDNKWNTPKVLLVGLPALEACINRTEGFKKGLLEVIPEAEIVAEVDGQGAKEIAMAKATDALTAHPDINVIMGINDDSTLGAVQAYRAAGLDESKLASFGFGVEGVSAKNELMNQDSPYKGGLGMFPENIGRLCVQTAYDAVKGLEVKDAEVPISVLNQDNIADYYIQDGDNWIIQWDAVDKLSK